MNYKNCVISICNNHIDLLTTLVYICSNILFIPHYNTTVYAIPVFLFGDTTCINLRVEGKACKYANNKTIIYYN